MDNSHLPHNLPTADESLTRKGFLKQGLNLFLNQVAQALPDIPELKLPVAIIEVTACTAYQGSGCQVCYDVCPLPEEAIRLNEGLPEVLSAGCTACGICVKECPTPEAIAIGSPG